MAVIIDRADGYLPIRIRTTRFAPASITAAKHERTPCPQRPSSRYTMPSVALMASSHPRNVDDCSLGAVIAAATAGLLARTREPVGDPVSAPAPSTAAHGVTRASAVRILSSGAVQDAESGRELRHWD